MKNVILTGILTLSAPLALAAGAPNSSHWTGTGHTYDLTGAETSSYTLDVQVQPGDAGKESVVVRITGADFAKTLICQQQNSGKAWTKTCDDGSKGDGYLFDYGLGQDYSVAADGTAYSTQIILDGTDKMRFERVELKNGQAVRFYAESLTKANP